MDSLGSISGFVALASLFLALALALRHRALRVQHSPAPAAHHVMAGLALAGLSLLHTFCAIPALGDPGAVRGGGLPLVFGAAAFVALLAHAGIGLELRKQALRKRDEKRRTHVMVAAALATLVLLHAGLLLAAR